MTLKDLLDSGFVKDDDVISIHMPLIGNLGKIRKGNWFSDKILDVMDRKIDTLQYTSWGDWDITLQSNEEDEEEDE